MNKSEEINILPHEPIIKVIRKPRLAKVQKGLKKKLLRNKTENPEDPNNGNVNLSFIADEDIFISKSSQSTGDTQIEKSSPQLNKEVEFEFKKEAIKISRIPILRERKIPAAATLTRKPEKQIDDLTNESGSSYMESAEATERKTIKSQGNGHGSIKVDERKEIGAQSARDKNDVNTNEKGEESDSESDDDSEEDSSTSTFTSSSVATSSLSSVTDINSAEKSENEKSLHSKQLVEYRSRLHKLKLEEDTEAKISNSGQQESGVGGDRKTDKRRHLGHLSSRKSNMSDPYTCTYEYVTGIRLHETSNLIFSELIRAPRVRVSWYDTNKGQFIQKSTTDRNVILNYEPENVNFIQPIISSQGEIVSDDGLSFSWDEVLIINEDIEFLKREAYLVFFELLDLCSPKSVTKRSNVVSQLFTSCMPLKMHTISGWYHICWAFLRPVSSDKTVYIGSRCKLQLYKYKKMSKWNSVYDQWSLVKREKYPATIDVTILPVKSTNESVGLNRPHTALQLDNQKSPAISSDSDSDICDVNANYGDLVRRHTERELRMARGDSNDSRWQYAWSLLKGGAFKLPNTELSKRILSKGSITCKFSCDGRMIAFLDEWTILVASSTDLKIIHNLRAHTGIINCLEWVPKNQPHAKQQDDILISASEDGTCIIWTLNKDKCTLQVLPHPSVVLSVVFVSYSNDNLNAIRLVSGGEDSILRIWEVDLEKKTPKLHQELSGHHSFIIGICSNAIFFTIYSCEVEGTMLEWSLDNMQKKWQNTRKIATIEGHVQQLVLHPKINRLYAMTNAALFSVDISSGFCRRTLMEPLTTPKPTSINRFVITKCGSHLFLSFSKENNVICCNLIKESVLNSIPVNVLYDSSISALDWNQQSNQLAVCTYGSYGGYVYIFGSSNQSSKKLRYDSDQLNKPSKQTVSFKKDNETIEMKSLEKKNRRNNEPLSRNWNEILDKFDDIFSLHGVPNRTDDDKKTCESDGTIKTKGEKEEPAEVIQIAIISPEKELDESSESEAPVSNCTFIISNSDRNLGNTFEMNVKKNQSTAHDGTFTINHNTESTKDNDDTDVSESLDSSG